jgi:hypothetical protein
VEWQHIGFMVLNGGFCRIYTLKNHIKTPLANDVHWQTTLQQQLID